MLRAPMVSYAQGALQSKSIIHQSHTKHHAIHDTHQSHTPPQNPSDELNREILNNTYKVLIVGNAGVGKTSIFKHYIVGQISSEPVVTTRIELGIKLIQTDGQQRSTIQSNHLMKQRQLRSNHHNHENTPHQATQHDENEDDGSIHMPQLYTIEFYDTPPLDATVVNSIRDYHANPRDHVDDNCHNTLTPPHINVTTSHQIIHNMLNRGEIHGCILVTSVTDLTSFSAIATYKQMLLNHVRSNNGTNDTNNSHNHQARNTTATSSNPLQHPPSLPTLLFANKADNALCEFDEQDICDSATRNHMVCGYLTSTDVHSKSVLHENINRGVERLLGVMLRNRERDIIAQQLKNGFQQRYHGRNHHVTYQQPAESPVSRSRHDGILRFDTVINNDNLPVERKPSDDRDTRSMKTSVNNNMNENETPHHVIDVASGE